MPHSSHKTIQYSQKTKVNITWETLRTTGTSNPLTFFEQLTCLLFIKGLDDQKTNPEKKSERIAEPIEIPTFSKDQDHLWRKNLKQLVREILNTIIKYRHSISTRTQPARSVWLEVYIGSPCCVIT